MPDVTPRDGGSAFPTLETETFHPQFGMSLRDYFAGQVLSGGLYHVGDAESSARKCYEIADAMLQARSALSGEG